MEGGGRNFVLATRPIPKQQAIAQNTVIKDAMRICTTALHNRAAKMVGQVPLPPVLPPTCMYCSLPSKLALICV